MTGQQERKIHCCQGEGKTGIMDVEWRESVAVLELLTLLIGECMFCEGVIYNYDDE